MWARWVAKCRLTEDIAYGKPNSCWIGGLVGSLYRMGSCCVWRVAAFRSLLVAPDHCPIGGVGASRLEFGPLMYDPLDEEREKWQRYRNAD